MDPALRPIYNGKHLDVFSYNPGTESDEFWVTFSSFQTPEPFGLRLFQKRNCRALFVVPRANEWYQHEEIWDALKLCREILDASLAKPIVYGSSMGGFAALAFSSDLNAHIVIAGSPQVSIAPGIVGSFDTRWSDIGKCLKFVRADCRDGLISDNRVYIVYDSLHKEDRRHAEMLISRPNVDAIPLPVSGHGVLHTLRDLGLVRKLIEALIQEDNQELVSEIRQEFRIRKRSSFNYYFALADRLMTQKRYQSASTFLRKSIEINPSFQPARKADQSDCPKQVQDPLQQNGFQLICWAGSHPAMGHHGEHHHAEAVPEHGGIQGQMQSVA